jgi:hypothetical protein
VLNLSDRAQRANFDLSSSTARCIFSTHKFTNESFSLRDLEIAPFEIFIAELHRAA